MCLRVLLPKVVFLFCLFNSIECKKLDWTSYEKWWGPDELKGSNDTSVRPFKVVFTEEMILDLKHRLLNYQPSSPSFPDTGFEYGFNSREMPGWIDYWANEYPFKIREDFLNQMPQFKTNVQGLDIHFIWVKPKVPAGVEVVPLLLLHGWPGSVREFYEAIPLLTAVSEDRDFALEIVVPSLPGFGYSDAAVRPGLSAEAMAVVLRNLMHRLGHKKFYIQGGDWGAFVGANIATLFQGEVLGYHTNLGLALTTKGLLSQTLGEILPSLVVSPALADRMYPLVDKALGWLREFGYLHLQSTKPDTLGICLSDSPAGLLSYIFQLISSGTRIYYVSEEDGGLNHYSKEALIDILMMYWASNSITTSFRIYAETLNKELTTEVIGTPTEVPTWVIQARYEIAYQSPIILQTKYPNLLHTTVLEDGGHFLALEMPKMFSDDVLDAVKYIRDWHANHTKEISD